MPRRRPTRSELGCRLPSSIRASTSRSSIRARSRTALRWTTSSILRIVSGTSPAAPPGRARGSPRWRSAVSAARARRSRGSRPCDGPGRAAFPRSRAAARRAMRARSPDRGRPRPEPPKRSPPLSGSWPVGHRPGAKADHRLAGPDGHDEEAPHAVAATKSWRSCGSRSRRAVSPAGPAHPRCSTGSGPPRRGHPRRGGSPRVRRALPATTAGLPPRSAARPAAAGPVGAQRRTDQGRYVEHRIHVELLAHRAGDLAEGRR